MNRSSRIAIVLVSLVSMPLSVVHLTAQSPDVLAVVNGVPITSEQVDAELGGQLATLREQIYRLRREQLDALIEAQLLEREAARRGITPQALEDAEISSQIQPVTTTDASAFFEANRARLKNGTFAALEARITTYLTSQRLAGKRQEFMASLRKNAAIDVRLEAPAPYRAEVPIAGAHVRGNAEAPVTIVEFSDFHCPYCRRAQAVIGQVLARYGDTVRLVFKDMPLDNLHPNARTAAEAALCAGAQGKFWEFHDALFASEPDVAPATLARLGQEAGLDLAAFDACRAARTYKAQVDASVEDGRRLGVTGTPTFFINGRTLTGAQPLDRFVEIIDEELAAAQPRTSAQRR